MANQEQLKILKSGFVEWNKWRELNPDMKADLRGAHLSGAILAGADLRGADLTEAILAGANLRGADLRGADLTEAHLSGANLTEAFLTEANLRGADLSVAFLTEANLRGANLSEADLTEAILSGANLSGADLTRAFLWNTVFGNVDLHTVIGLHFCRHDGPSILDHRTLMRSGDLPLKFLQGCGLPDTLIKYLPSLTEGPVIQFYSCFISYANPDQECADRLHADLQSKGVRCWFAPEDLKVGDRFRQRIDEAIQSHDRFLVLLSEHSVESDWVREEVEACLERERLEKRTVLFPVQLDDAVDDTQQAWAASIRRQRHIGNFRDWENHAPYKKSFERLLRDLKAEEARP